MQIGKVSFSKQGYEDFKNLTKNEQVIKLKKLMPLYIKVENLLKNIPYVKPKKDKRKDTESKQSVTTSKHSSKGNTKRSDSKD
jgi:hypothetical protein